MLVELPQEAMQLKKEATACTATRADSLPSSYQIAALYVYFDSFCGGSGVLTESTTLL